MENQALKFPGNETENLSPLQSIYSVVFMGSIPYKVKNEGQIKNKAAFMVIGIDLDGKKMSWEYGQEKQKVPNSGLGFLIS